MSAQLHAELAAWRRLQPDIDRLSALLGTCEGTSPLAAAAAEIERLRDPPTRATTHCAHCWRWHHGCAIAEVERLRAGALAPAPAARRRRADSPGLRNSR